MAMQLKCTKIQIGGRPVSGSGLVSVVCDFVDPTVVPALPGSIATEVTYAESTDTGDLQAAIDTALTGAGMSTMDWDL